MLSLSEFMGRVHSAHKENELILSELASLEILLRTDRDGYPAKKMLLTERMRASRFEMDGLIKAWSDLKAVLR